MASVMRLGLGLALAAACGRPTLPPPATANPAGGTDLPTAVNPPATVQTATLPVASDATTPTPEPPTPTPAPLGDGIHWTKHTDNPVLDFGPEGAWDGTSVGGARVVKTESGYLMMYTGFDGTRVNAELSFDYGYSLGLASSPDGMTWEKHLLNPVLTLPGGEFGMLWHDMVVEGGVYYAYYTRGGSLDGRTALRIYQATSPDGLVWTPGDTPLIELGPTGSYDDLDVIAPAVLVEDGLFKMWYTAVQDRAGSSIAYATSEDGLVWAKYEGNPVLAVPGASYPAVVKFGDGYLMWYSAGESIHLATSPDGIGWTPHPENPVLRPGEDEQWDSRVVMEPSVVFDGRVFHMWFTGSNGEFQEKIGYATSP